MKKFEDMTLNEQKDLTEILWSWLDYYTDEVINNVIPKVNDIINNEAAMFMLKELYLRDREETIDYRESLHRCLRNGAVSDFRRIKSITHSQSYRDVLADMYINPEWQRSKKTENNAE